MFTSCVQDPLNLVCKMFLPSRNLSREGESTSGQAGECPGLGVRAGACLSCPWPSPFTSGMLIFTFCKIQGLDSLISGHFSL